MPINLFSGFLLGLVYSVGNTALQLTQVSLLTALKYSRIFFGLKKKFGNSLRACSVRERALQSNEVSITRI